MALRRLHMGLLAMIAGTAFGFSTAQAATNRPPTISGTPPASVAAGSTYTFTPYASDPDRRQWLRFSISSKPAWASFNAWTGRLSGTPSAAHAGTTSGIVIRVSDGRLSAALPAFSITVTGGANRPPVLSGVPGTSATVGTAYDFAPSAHDPDGDALTWSISGKPAGASFNVSTGRLTWTPAAPGTSGNIVISVTDSRGATASLPAFTIVVSTPPPSAGTATLSWMAPTQYTDGSPLPASQLAAYRIYRGASPGSLARVAEVDSRTLVFAVQSLPSGTHYFAVTAVTLAGVESALSAVGSKSIQ
jgi:hypothetical protein